ncbi:MAG TPA: OmpH family outer membrane protein [Cytophagales bacterium]|nr:OmpH family outer membrane protein [Cytophagales bacterium]
MKTVLKPLFFIAAVAVSICNLNAQSKALKLGYTNVEEILYQMPESKEIEANLKTYRTQLETQLQQKMAEFEEKAKVYESGKAVMSEPVRAMKEKDLQATQEQIQSFQRDAEADLQRKQNELLEPVLGKIRKAIDDVANENGYTWIFNTESGFGQQTLIKMPKEDDITALVLKKLGITPKPAATGAGTGTNTAPKAPAKTGK